MTLSLMSLWYEIETDLPDINIVKRTSFSAGQTMEGGEVIPEHPVQVSIGQASSFQHLN